MLYSRLWKKSAIDLIAALTLIVHVR